MSVRPVSILPHAALPAPEVSVRDEGSAMAGSDYSLFCDVTIPPLSDATGVSEPVVIWTHPSGTRDRPLFGNSGQLLFSPLTTDDCGVYTCTVYYLVKGTTSPQTSSDYHVTISESVWFCILHFCKLCLGT